MYARSGCDTAERRVAPGSKAQLTWQHAFVPACSLTARGTAHRGSSANILSHPHGQELHPSARFVRSDMEETSRLAAVKLTQGSAEADTVSSGSVDSPGTPGASAAPRYGGAASAASAAAPPAATSAAPKPRPLPRVSRSVTDIVGGTPMVYLSDKTTAGCVATVVAKLESSEPCCSVKDRCAARWMPPLRERIPARPCRRPLRSRAVGGPRKRAAHARAQPRCDALFAAAASADRGAAPCGACSIGVAMVDAAEREGKIQRGVTTLVEPTSGVPVRHAAPCGTRRPRCERLLRAEHRAAAQATPASRWRSWLRRAATS
jgi:hypothetical protein